MYNKTVLKGCKYTLLAGIFAGCASLVPMALNSPCLNSYWPEWDYNIETNLIWIGYKKTDSMFLKNELYELSCVITDDKFNIIKELPSIKIIRSLLLQKVTSQKPSMTFETGRELYTFDQAQDKVMCFIEHFTYKDKPSLCSTKSAHKTSCFLACKMPQVLEYIHDVHDCKMLTIGLKKNNYFRYVKAQHATILEDIKETIKEYKYYCSLQDGSLACQ